MAKLRVDVIAGVGTTSPGLTRDVDNTFGPTFKVK